MPPGRPSTAAGRVKITVTISAATNRILTAQRLKSGQSLGRLIDDAVKAQQPARKKTK